MVDGEAKPTKAALRGNEKHKVRNFCLISVFDKQSANQLTRGRCLLA